MSKPNSTESCKEEIVKVRPTSHVSDWKRIAKIGSKDLNVRTFNHRRTGEVLQVIYNKFFCPMDDETEYTVVSGDQIQAPPSTTVTMLLAACNLIKHCGDYCHLYWNNATKTAHLTMGDGDGCEDEGSPFTSFDTIETLLESAGADTVVIADEWSPSVADGYVCLGEDLGVTVNWDD